MNKIVALFFMFFSFCSFSQSDTIIYNAYFDSYLLEYGQKFFQDDFNGKLKSINNIELNSLSVETISMTYLSNSIPVNRKFTIAGYLRFSYLIPKTINVDSSNLKIRGFNMTFPFYGKNLIYRRYFTSFLTTGFQVGRLKLVREVNEQKQKMKNMTIAPYVGLVAKVNISRICISFIAQYDYDISSKMWTKQWFHKGQDFHFDGLRQSGLTFSTGVGYAF